MSKRAEIQSLISAIKTRKIYSEIGAQLGAGIGMLRIAKTFAVHHSTVASVRDAELEKVDDPESKTP